jgi:hypothetical protein
MAIQSNKIDRLKSQLLTSGLSQKDSPLYQVINQLIDATKELIDEFNNIDNSSNVTNISGSSSVSGPPGMMGLPGMAGSIGPPGASGDTGPQGPITLGPMGMNGLDGLQGMSIPGNQGVQGIQGIDGPQGPITQGPMGLNGRDGLMGMSIPGPLGPTGPTGSNAPLVLLAKTAPQTINAGAGVFVDITDLTFPVLNGFTYSFKFHIVWQSAATGTGWKTSVNCPTGTLNFFTTLQTVANSATVGVSTWLHKHSVTRDDLTTLTSTITAGVDLVVIVEGRYLCTADGTFAVRFANELAANTDIVVQEGSWGMYWQQ